MSDNSFGTTFGPSAPGAINLVVGRHGRRRHRSRGQRPVVATPTAPNADITADGMGGFSLTSDAQPYWDDCSTRDAVALSGTNIGDELNARGLSWGWFQGGFRPTTSYRPDCGDRQDRPADEHVHPGRVQGAGSQALVRRTRRTRASATRFTRSAPRFGATRASARGATRTTTSRTTSRSSTTPRRRTRTTCSRPMRRQRLVAGLQAIGTDTQSLRSARRAAVRHAEPQLRHERLRPARRGDQQRTSCLPRRCRR